MKLLRLLPPYFRPHRKLFLLDMICAVLAAAIDLAFPLVSRYAMYDLLPGKKYRFFFVMMAAVCAVYVLRSLCFYIMTYWGHLFGVRVEADMRRDLFAHIQTLDFTFFDRNRTGQIMNRMTGDLFEITELVHHGPEDLMLAVLTIAGSLFFMFRIQWKLALVIACMVPVFVGIVMWCRRSMSEASMAQKQTLAGITSELEGSISGIRTSKAFHNEKYDFARFERSNDDYRNAKKDYYRAMARFNAWQNYFICAMPAAIIAVGGYLIMGSEMTLVDLVTFTLFSNAFIQPINKLAQFAEVFVSGFAGLRRFDEIMRMEPEIRDEAGARPLVIRGGAVEAEHVSFSYPESGEILHDITFSVRPGEKVAVVGPSGGGKTTLCQLIPRFYDVTKGAIRIDGTDVRDVTLASLRGQIGVVQQDVFIFADTIYENIRYGRPDASDEEVAEAARRAEILDMIEALPDGFDTYVGERGTRLSGGQKQRISIARIFLKDPKVLILDEATSALDTVTEARIQKSFDELSKGRTSLVIAHRLATVKNADRIILIEGGRIAESGTHEELLRLGGGYAKLYETQQLLGSEEEE